MSLIGTGNMLLDRVSRSFETCEKYRFLNNQNKCFYEIDLKKIRTRFLETYINSAFSKYNVRRSNANPIVLINHEHECLLTDAC